MVDYSLEKTQGGFGAMLVISRKVEEGVRIGDHIEIKILDVYATDNSGTRKSKVASIGINAPREISILRRELYDTREENRHAAEHVADISQKEQKELTSLLRKKAKSHIED